MLLILDFTAISMRNGVVGRMQMEKKFFSGTVGHVKRITVPHGQDAGSIDGTSAE